MMKLSHFLWLIVTVLLLTSSSNAQVTVDSFGFQCGLDTNNCPKFTWPPSPAQPGVFRLWDTGVDWAQINTASGVYTWTTFDSWLDQIATHQPRQVIYTFGYIPCWLSTISECNWFGSENAMPTDLTTQGSPAFTAFVNALTQHCSVAGHCVKDYIQYFELWNEANEGHWSGTVTQLYQMLAPVVPIIRKNISNAKITTPTINDAAGFQAWMVSWLQLEVANGVLSDIYNFHTYLGDRTPETRFSFPFQQMLCPNNGFNGVCKQVAGWTTKPFWNDETNFNTNSENFTCNPSLYSAADCAGQVVRWQVLQAAVGEQQLNWYFWYNTIGTVALNESAYYYMMKYMTGGKFTAACSAISTTYTCPFIQQNGFVSLFVWTTSESGAAFTVPPGYNHYLDFAGASDKITTQTILISVGPLLLEQLPIPAPPQTLKVQTQ
jgi:hypothetical protein